MTQSEKLMETLSFINSKAIDDNISTQTLCNQITSLKSSLLKNPIDAEEVVYKLSILISEYDLAINFIQGRVFQGPRNLHIDALSTLDLFKLGIESQGDLFVEEDYEMKNQKNEDVSVSEQTCKKIFISHSSKDNKFLDCFHDFLVKLGIDDKSIFYTSKRSCGIPPNEDTPSYIKNKLNEQNTLILFMLSDNFFGSPYCMNEVGAIWVKTNAKYSNFYLPGFTHNDLKKKHSFVDDKRSAYNFEKNDLLIFIETLSSIMKPKTQQRINEIIDDLLVFQKETTKPNEILSGKGSYFDKTN